MAKANLTDADKADMQKAATMTMEPASLSQEEIQQLRATNQELLKTLQDERRGRNAHPSEAYKESRDYIESLRNRVAGKYRWQVRIPNYVHYLEFDCDYGENQQAQAISEYESRLHTQVPKSHRSKFEFTYMGETKDLGPANLRRPIPPKERRFTWGKMPSSLRSFLEKD